jgi:uncharacterized protein YndB with AHSA1/START domain
MTDTPVIDTSTIAATGPFIRSVVRETEVAAAVLDVWMAWTSEEQIDAWWGPPASNIDLRIGGPFELLFDIDAPAGRRGSEGCRYLGYVPGEMISFTWNAPPHLALRETNTWVVITFAALGPDRTKVRLVHSGFLEGHDWDAYLSYFEGAWTHVLRLLSEHWD